MYKLLLLGASLIWGASFVFMKNSVDVLGPATLVAVRFVSAALLMLVFFWPKIIPSLKKDNVKAGVFLGILYFLAYWTQTVGLTDTTPGKNAFLTAAYVVMVPFIFWVISKARPNMLNVLAAFVCLVGIGFVSLDAALAISFGDAMTLVCAFFFALHIAFLGKLAQGREIYTLAFVQFVTVGVSGLVIGLPTEALPTLDQITPDFIGQMLYLIVGATFLAVLFQNIGQAHVPPSQAALLLSLESVFGVAFSIVLYGEIMTASLIFGFALIFVAVLINELLAPKMESKRAIVASEKKEE